MTRPDAPGEPELSASLQALFAGDYQGAAALMEAELENRPDDPALLCNYGAALQSLGRPAEAAAQYRRALDLGGQPAALLAYNLGAALALSGDREGAEEAYLRAIELEPTMAAAHGNLGVLRYQWGDLEGAEDALRASIELDPEDVVVRCNLGAVQCARGDGDAAAETYRAARALAAGDPAPVCGLATALVVAGRHREAVNVLEGWAGDRQPDVMRQLAAAHAQAGDHVASERVYRELRALLPEDAAVASGLGAALEAQGKREQAQEAFGRALELAPDWADAHYNLGVSLERGEHFALAIEAYRHAVRLDPDHLLALRNMAGAMRSAGRGGEARETYRRVLELDPDDQVVQHLLAALDGASSSRAPAAYVREVFDDYAPRYEAHMREQLEYRGPEEILRLIDESGIEGPFHRVLDLGCGTGLMGRLLRARAGELIGVDLSPRMLEASAEAGYDSVALADLNDYGSSLPAGSVALCTCADALIYLGDLAPVFASVSHALAPGGLWAFSVELGEGPADFELTPTGRFRHRRSYLERLGEARGFALRAADEVGLRLERDVAVDGLVAVMVRT